MFLKKKRISATEDSKIILGMIMLPDENSFDVDSFVKDYNNNYADKIQSFSGDSSSITFKVDNEMVGIAHALFPIPSGDIEEAASYAYYWETAFEETKQHKSHLIVSIIQGGRDQIKRFKIFTQVICSLLRTTNSLGVYKGNQSLLISKEGYLNEAVLMKPDYLPLNLWVYFGLRNTENGNSGYTYGLKEFNKTEMEVLNSVKSLEDIRDFLFSISHYALEYDVAFKEGQTYGRSEEERIGITISKGKFVGGDTFKLAY
jgi:hypothetical protein